MGCWDAYCFLCGNVVSIKYLIDQMESSSLNVNFKQLRLVTNWINKCTILLENGGIVHNTKEVECNVIFDDGKSLYKGMI